MAFRIAVLAEKGGVGKTTTVAHLGAALARRGHRPLLIDLDPQKNLTEWIGPSNDGVAERNIFRVLEDPFAPLADFIVPSRIDGVALICGARGLGLADRLLGTTKSGRPRDPNNVLETALQQLPEEYDVVLMDGPPSVGQINGNAIVAAQLVVVPIEPGEFAFRGLTKIGETIKEMLGERILEEAPAIAALLTLVKSGRLTTTMYEEEARKALHGYERGHVFSTQVRYREAMQRLPKILRTAYDTSVARDVATDYEHVADELIAFLTKLGKAAAK